MVQVADFLTLLLTRHLMAMARAQIIPPQLLRECLFLMENKSAGFFPIVCTVIAAITIILPLPPLHLPPFNIQAPHALSMHPR